MYVCVKQFRCDTMSRGDFMNKKDKKDFSDFLDDANIDDEMDRLLDEPDRYATLLYRTGQLSDSDTLNE